jgi:hypothetical protein
MALRQHSHSAVAGIRCTDSMQNAPATVARAHAPTFGRLCHLSYARLSPRKVWQLSAYALGCAVPGCKHLPWMFATVAQAGCCS